MTKFTLTIALLIIPMLALISEAVITPKKTTAPFQPEDHALTAPQTASSQEGIILTNRKQGNAPLKVQFDAIINNAPSNSTIYNWNFGDGRAAQGKRVIHAFTIPGEYTTTLTITDRGNFTAQHSTIITVTDKT